MQNGNTSPLLVEKTPAIHVARHIIKRMPGGSGSLLVFDWNCKAWIVKFTQNPQHSRLALNEWLASRIAREVGLKVPDSGIVEVGLEILDDYRPMVEYPKLRAMYQPGLQFGSRFAGRLMPGFVLDPPPSDQWHNVSNLHEVLGALVFDTWLNNTDRRQAIFVRPGRSRALDAVWIDHGNCFGENWHLQAPSGRAVFRTNPVYDLVESFSSFEPWLSRIEALSLEFLRHTFYQAPEPWRMGDEFAFELLVKKLEARQARIRTLLLDVIYKNRNRFPNWRKEIRSSTQTASCSLTGLESTLIA